MTPATEHFVTADRVQKVLSRHLLTRGMMPLVLDMEQSGGVHLYDRISGREFLDLFGFYASSTVGMNHPKLLNDEGFLRRLKEAALNKITNSDVMTEHLADFVQTFGRVAIPEAFPHAFFVSGGALAVENALKAAFDWKVKKNRRKGYRRDVGQQVLHFEQAFHGRTGYTMSLTNTADPRKTAHFPKFDWPRVVNPKVRFPLDEEALAVVEEAEALALLQAKQHFRDRRDDIACVIIEPIQGEGGDNHFRPSFLHDLRDLAHENDALLIFDEVQTGVGLTGAFWAYQALGVEPDLIAFGKKTQVCGMLAGGRIDEVEDNVFEVPSRLNSTWGGNLVDMVRFGRILEVIEEDGLVRAAEQSGAFLQELLHDLSQEHDCVTNVRGRGLMCAFDLPDKAFRDKVLERCYEEGVIILGSGVRSVRFRPPLIITPDDLRRGIGQMGEAISAVKSGAGALGTVPIEAVPHEALRED